MAKLVLVVLSLATTVSAFVTPQSSRSSVDTKIFESFGFDIAEDTYENQPDFLKGEEEYKAWLNTVKDNNFLNRQVCPSILGAFAAPVASSDSSNPFASVPRRLPPTAISQ